LIRRVLFFLSLIHACLDLGASSMSRGNDVGRLSDSAILLQSGGLVAESFWLDARPQNRRLPASTRRGVPTHGWVLRAPGMVQQPRLNNRRKTYIYSESDPFFGRYWRILRRNISLSILYSPVPDVTS
jgi:hypothetical protein